MNLQPTDIENELIKLVPLQSSHFDELYRVASDPLVWEQHPNKERYKKEVFESFFAGGMDSRGAFAVMDTKTGELIGSSRFYDYDPVNKTVVIGYTFLGRPYWGKGYNRNLKTLMLNYAFNYADTVIFHIGANNMRSQIAIGKIGAIKFKEEEMAYAGDPRLNLNYFYKITKEMWAAVQAKAYQG